MPQSALFKLSKQMKQANALFVPIPASIEKKRPIGPWAGSSYNFETEFQKREQSKNVVNLGLLVNGYIVVDVDNKPPAVKGDTKIYSVNKGTDDFAALTAENEALPPTLTSGTPSGGTHYYFARTGKAEEKLLKNWSACMTLNNQVIAVDIRVNGGYVMCPPSTKEDGEYTWENKEGFKAPMAPLPNWILRNILESTKKNVTHFEKQAYTNNPSLNDEVGKEDVEAFKNSVYWQDCFKVGEANAKDNIINFIATEPYDCAICKRRHVKNSNHPFLVRHQKVLLFVCRSGKGFNARIDPDFQALERNFHVGIRKFMKTGDFTDAAYSELLYEQLDGRVLATANPKNWMHFDEKTGIWKEENKTVITRPLCDKLAKLFKDYSYILGKIAQQTEDDDFQGQAILADKAAVTLRMMRNKTDILAALFEKIRKVENDKLYNTKDHLLHFTNGVFDLDSGIFREAECSDYSTLCTNLAYKPYEEHPAESRELIEGFIDSVMGGDDEKMKYALKVLCSSLSGWVEDQQFYVLFGRGANGKSTLINLLKAGLGDYACSIPSAQITKANTSAQSASPCLMSMENKRGAFCTELEDKTLHTEVIKMLAGGDSSSGRQLYGTQKEIRFKTKVFLAMNDVPVIVDKTHGFWRKLVLIPLNTMFVDHEPDQPHQRRIVPGIEKKILACADTFMALLVKTYITAYKKEGVKRDVQPKVVRDAGLQYQYSQNIPLRFIESTFRLNRNPRAIVKITDVNESFDKWCREFGIRKDRCLVANLHEQMDEKCMKTNDRRQIKVNGTNIKGWRGIEFEVRWEMEEDADDDDDDEMVVDLEMPQAVAGDKRSAETKKQEDQEPEPKKAKRSIAKAVFSKTSLPGGWM